MAHPNDELIERFYAAFARLDGEAMAECYSPWAHFSDPVFGDLRDKEPGAMWRMLTGRARDLKVTLLEHNADHERGQAHWTADYTFSTGHKVHNDVRARFRFEEGWIVEHRDMFSFYAWARQGMAGTGTALGWTPLLRRMVRRKARADLDAFITGRPAPEPEHGRRGVGRRGR
jgi:ketosteroid isomerase-like protein